MCSLKSNSLFQFCPRLTKGGGRLEHEHVGAAIYTLNKKLKVANLMLKGKRYHHNQIHFFTCFFFNRVFNMG